MRTRSIFATALAAGFVIATPALADLTAASLWEDLENLLESGGANVTIGSKRAFGTAVTLSDLVIDGELPEDGGPFTAAFSQIVLRNALGDAVDIVLSPDAPITVRDQTTTFDLAAEQSGRLTQDAETDQRREFTFDLPEFDALVQNLTVDDQPADLDIALSIRGLVAAFSTFPSVTSGRLLAEPAAFSINALDVAIEDARVTATGALTFDTSPDAALSPDPTPIGSLSIEIDGANRLLQLLVDRGVIGQGDVMGVMFGLGFFTREGDGPDTRVAVIDFGEDGSIKVNGQIIR